MRQTVEAEPPRCRDLVWHAKTRAALTGMFKDATDPETKENAVLLAMWLAFDYPGGGLAAKVSQSLRKQGRAHLTMGIDADGIMAIALADGFVDLRKTLDIVNRGNEPFEFIEKSVPASATSQGPKGVYNA